METGGKVMPVRTELATGRGEIFPGSNPRTEGTHTPSSWSQASVETASLLQKQRFAAQEDPRPEAEAGWGWGNQRAFCFKAELRAIRAPQVSSKPRLSEGVLSPSPSPPSRNGPNRS